MCLIYLMNGSLIIKQRKSPKHEFMGFLRSPHALTGISGGSQCRGSSKDLRKKVYICRLSVTPGRSGDRAEDVPATGEAQLATACKQVSPGVQDVVTSEIWRLG